MRISPESLADLELTDYAAFGNLEITFDFHASQSSAVDLSSAYFYTGTRWTFTQEGQECPYTDSDIDEFGRRHMLRLTVNRLERGAWARIKIKGRTTLQYGKKESLKNEYPVSGRVGFRIHTRDDVITVRETISTSFVEIPF